MYLRTIFSALSPIIRGTGLLLLALVSHGAQADSLRDIYELALTKDPQLRGAQATYRANLEPQVQARARLLPQLVAEGNYDATHREQETQLANVTAGDIGVDRSYQDTSVRNAGWNVRLQQPLFDLPAWFEFRSGKLTGEQARAEFAHAQQELAVRVAEAYFGVLRAQDNVRAAQAEEKAALEQMHQAEERFNAGMVGIADVQQAKAAYQTSVAQRAVDEGELIAAEEALTALTGVPHGDLRVLNTGFPVVPPTPADRAEWVRFALENNYALKAAIAAMQAADETASARSMEHMPKITGSLSYQENTAHGDQEITPASPFATQPDAELESKSAMIHVTVPLFSSGYTSSASRQAYAQYEAALEKKTETERALIRDTRATHVAASADVQRVLAQQEAIGAAQTALDATRAAYRAGMKSIVDVLVSQRALFAARRDYASARYDYVLHMLKLKLLAGTIGPADIHELDGWLVQN
jgi:outer membrane protein